MKNIALFMALLTTVLAAPALAAESGTGGTGTDVMKGCANMPCCQSCCGCCTKQ